MQIHPVRSLPLPLPLPLQLPLRLPLSLALSLPQPLPLPLPHYYYFYYYYDCYYDCWFCLCCAFHRQGSKTGMLFHHFTYSIPIYLHLNRRCYKEAVVALCSNGISCIAYSLSAKGAFTAPSSVLGTTVKQDNHKLLLPPPPPLLLLLLVLPSYAEAM